MKVVVGLYDDIRDAQRAVEALRNAGIPRDDISLVAYDRTGEFGSYLDREGDTTRRTTETTDDVGDGTLAGAGIGAVLGGLGGLLVGLGALAIPGIGPIVAAGPIVATLAGAGIGAAAGGIVGALVDLGLPEEQAQYYAEGVRRGGTLVTVQASDEMTPQVVDIMNRFDPIDIERRAEYWRNEGWEGYEPEAGAYEPELIETEREGYRDWHSERFGETEGEIVAEEVEEEMRVGKREVLKGGVRVKSYIREEPFEQDVQVTEEHIDVERRKVDRPATEKDFEAFEEGAVEMTETTEEVVVEKRPHVTEEVRVSKDVDTHTETVRDTLRHKEVEVERLGEDWDEFEPGFRQHYQTSFASTDYDYDYYAPAYQYGYTLANDERYSDYDWNRLEPVARRDWERRHDESTWEQVKDAVREGWYRVTH